MSDSARSLTTANPEAAQTHNVVYLACPYTHPDPEVRKLRFEIVNKVAADLILSGRIVFSPITMTHPLDMLLAGETNTLGSDYWVAFDVAFMEMCSEMIVLTLEGWDQSSGIRREIAYFKDRKKPIRYMAPPDSISSRP